MIYIFYHSKMNSGIGNLKKVKIMVDFITVQGITGLRKTHLKKKIDSFKKDYWEQMILKYTE